MSAKHLTGRRPMCMIVQLTFEPHDNHEDVDCECQASDRTAAYVHDLIALSYKNSKHISRQLYGLITFIYVRQIDRYLFQN